MFEYAKADLENKIQDIEKEISLKSSKYEDYKNNVQRFLSCVDLKKDIVSYKKNIVAFTLLTVMFVMGSVFAFSYSSILALIFSIVSALCSFISISATCKIIKSERMVYKQYSDISMFSNSELIEKIKFLRQEENIVCSELSILYREKNRNSIKLDKVIRYQNVVDEVLDEVINNPYYQADNRNQFEILSATLEEREKFINDFLLESRRYSGLETYNDIEKPLRIVKKY